MCLHALPAKTIFLLVMAVQRLASRVQRAPLPPLVAAFALDPGLSTLDCFFALLRR